MDHSAHGTHLSSVGAMALSGFAPAAVVPGVVWLLRRAPLWERVSLPPGIALPLLVLLHAWAVLADLVRPLPVAVTFGSELVLLWAAVTFWLPVVAHTRHRLSDPCRCLYLFLAAPLLDLPALGVIAAGHSAEGLAMIVGMLPLGIVAAAVTWSWIHREEREAVDALPLMVRAGDPDVR
ncbi:hypothetical protein ABT063_47515 [Streptomyces sp. NPDC002838]|uniref:hypothetical protein n=1 Tax=Streptomyces sp. NPDC002838 TaxID=3154436 RepID=UPI00331A32DD